MRGDISMPQDPEQQPRVDDAPDPQFPYGATPLAPPASSLYTSPEFYTAQQNTPASPSSIEQSGYTVPTPNAYQAPQALYGGDSNYGHGGVSQGYGYSAPLFEAPQPQATPLPLGEAVRQLPAQYWRVIMHPSRTTFAAEMGKARWNIVWVQIVIYIVIVTIFGILSNIFVQPVGAAAFSGTDPTLTPSTIAIVQRLYTFIALLGSYGQILLIPLSLFIGTGLLFMLAKAFGGVGKFLPQLYSSLLFLVPLGILFNVLAFLFSLLPGVGSLLSFLVIFGYFGYESTLLGLMLMAVHRLSGGRATGAVLSLFGVAFLLFCILGFIIAIVFAATQPTP